MWEIGDLGHACTHDAVPAICSISTTSHGFLTLFSFGATIRALSMSPTLPCSLQHFPQNWRCKHSMEINEKKKLYRHNEILVYFEKERNTSTCDNTENP